MTDRERFVETLCFGRPDRVPLEPGHPRESTLAAWHQQGLPESVNWHAYLLAVLGIAPDPDRCAVDLGVSLAMIPAFEEKVLEHRDGHYIVQDWMGAITEISDTYNYTYIRSPRDFVTRRWHRFPVQAPRDWEERIRWRYDPQGPGRFPADFDERCRALRDRDTVLTLSINGPFWQLREWCGLEGLCVLMMDESDFVFDMVRFWADFVVRMLNPILERVTPDQVVISEDMAYKLHSMISPRMVRRFLLPTYQKWVSAIKASGCPLVSVDSDGYIGELIPLWIEAGFNGCTPIEVAAGNDIVEFRERFGQRMAYQGGIDKRALAIGGETMRAEVLRVVPPLLKEGGFIPGVDHGVPPDISWQNFIEYSRLLAQLTGWI
jgi:Uroporphyrinogen decarboxylase (URO-D)